MTDRIPVLPKFTPSHVLVDGHTGDLPFGDVFDIPRLSSLIKSPVLEWRDIKIDEQPVTESLGCWAVWPEQQTYEPTPREGWYPRGAGLGGFRFSTPVTRSPLIRFLARADISYTKAPSWLRANPGDPNDKTARFWDLARLSFPDARREWLNSGQPIEQTPSPVLNTVEDPDQQMLCMDYLYYVGAITGVRSLRRTSVIYALIPPSSRTLNILMTFPPHGDTSSLICTGPSVLRPSGIYISGTPLALSLINRSPG